MREFRPCLPLCTFVWTGAPRTGARRTRCSVVYDMLSGDFVTGRKAANAWLPNSAKIRFDNISKPCLTRVRTAGSGKNAGSGTKDSTSVPARCSRLGGLIVSAPCSSAWNTAKRPSLRSRIQRTSVRSPPKGSASTLRAPGGEERSHYVRRVYRRPARLAAQRPQDRRHRAGR